MNFILIVFKLNLSKEVVKKRLYMGLKVKCTNCGTWNDSEDKFCKDCGYAIESTSESKLKHYSNKIVNKQAVFILILFFMIDIAGINFENSIYGNTFKYFMFVNDQLVDTTSKYFKNASIPLIILSIIQAVIFELIFYLDFYRRTQFRDYYQFYLSIPLIHWLIIFFVTLLLALLNNQFFTATLILLLTGSQIGLMHLMLRAMLNKNGRNNE